MNRTETKLWYRHVVKPKIVNIKQFIFSKTFLELIIAFLGIYYAFMANQLTQRGNKLSETAFNLSQKDTNQQAQINRLQSLVIKIDSQNRLTSSQNALIVEQNKQLIYLTKLGTEQDSLSNQLLYKVQSQLDLAKSVNRRDNLLAYEEFNNLARLLHNLFYQAYIENLRDSTLYPQGYEGLEHDSTFISIITQVRGYLEVGLRNPIVIENASLLDEWKNFYFKSKYHLEGISKLKPNTQVIDANGRKYITHNQITLYYFSDFVNQFVKFYPVVFNMQKIPFKSE